MGEQGKQGLADLMTSLGMSKPLNTKEERVSDLTCPPHLPSHVSSSDYWLACLAWVVTTVVIHLMASPNTASIPFMPCRNGKLNFLSFSYRGYGLTLFQSMSLYRRFGFLQRTVSKSSWGSQKFSFGNVCSAWKMGKTSELKLDVLIVTWNNQTVSFRNICSAR